MASNYQRFVAAAMRAVRPRTLSQARQVMRSAAAEWRRRRRSNPNARKRKKRQPIGGTWQPDLFGGRGIERREGATRAEQLELARQEMRDTGSRDLFDYLREQNPAAAARYRNAVAHGETRQTAETAARDPGAAIGRTSPPCPSCGASVRLHNPTRTATVTCSSCGQTSRVRRP